MTEELTYRALDMLEGHYAPKAGRGRDRRGPYWRPRPAPISSVHTPAWDWESVSRTDGARGLVTLDVNAAFLAAASSVKVAHGQLEHTGPGMGQLLPGYYKIRAHSWPPGSIVSPLGSAPTKPEIWVAHPTLKLLQDREEEGCWPETMVLDSWTCPVGVGLQSWTTEVRDDRARALDTMTLTDPQSADYEQAKIKYEAIKLGYSQAIQLMLKGEKCRAHRPDWVHAIWAQHAANTWRKAWNCEQAGCGPARMANVDELTFDYDDYMAIMAYEKPPIRVDQTGVTLGSLKIKHVVGVSAGHTADRADR